MRYPFASLRDFHKPYMEELKKAACDVIESGWYLKGDYTAQFETNLAALCGVPHAVAVSNGLDALTLIFRAYIELGAITPGDEVIVPANTFVASVLAITRNGLVPVFVDADAATMNLDTAALKRAVSKRTRAILTVHLYGAPCYDEQLKSVAAEHNLIIVEDNAQAINAKSAVPSSFGTTITGSLGDAAAFSFYPAKNLGALGDAGAVTTHNPELAKVVSELAYYGSDVRYKYRFTGYNCRMDEIQAAMLMVKLKYLEQETRRREEVAAAYTASIKNPSIILPGTTPGARPVWHQYVVRCKQRDALRSYLLENGVGSDIHYPIPPHKQECYAEYNSLSMPVAEMLSQQVLSLPIANVNPRDAEIIAGIIDGFEL